MHPDARRLGALALRPGCQPQDRSCLSTWRCPSLRECPACCCPWLGARPLRPRLPALPGHCLLRRVWQERALGKARLECPLREVAPGSPCWDGCGPSPEPRWSLPPASGPTAHGVAGAHRSAPARRPLRVPGWVRGQKAGWKAALAEGGARAPQITPHGTRTAASSSLTALSPGHGPGLGAGGWGGSPSRACRARPGRPVGAVEAVGSLGRARAPPARRG